MKTEFVAKLDGSYRKKIQNCFIRGYYLGFGDGTDQDRSLKSPEDLEKILHEMLKETDEK